MGIHGAGLSHYHGRFSNLEGWCRVCSFCLPLVNSCRANENMYFLEHFYRVHFLLLSICRVEGGFLCIEWFLGTQALTQPGNSEYPLLWSAISSYRKTGYPHNPPDFSFFFFFPVNTQNYWPRICQGTGSGQSLYFLCGHPAVLGKKWGLHVCFSAVPWWLSMCGSSLSLPSGI